METDTELAEELEKRIIQCKNKVSSHQYQGL